MKAKKFSFEKSLTTVWVFRIWQKTPAVWGFYAFSHFLLNCSEYNEENQKFIFMCFIRRDIWHDTQKNRAEAIAVRTRIGCILKIQCRRPLFNLFNGKKVEEVNV